NAQHVSIEAVAVVPNGNMPLEAIVERIRLRAPHLMLDSAGPQDRSIQAVRVRDVWRNHADADRTIAEHLARTEDRLVFVDPRRELAQELVVDPVRAHSGSSNSLHEVCRVD